MAKIGLRHVVAAKLEETGGAAVYTLGRVVGRTMSASVKVASETANLYADDVLAETYTAFTSGTLTLGVAEVTQGASAFLLGHTLDDGELVSNIEDAAPYVGVGFYAPVVKKGVRRYQAVWLCKCQFSEPSGEFKTKGEKTEFSADTIEGTFMALSGGDWRHGKIAETETDAVAWLESKAGITPGGNGGQS